MLVQKIDSAAVTDDSVAFWLERMAETVPAHRLLCEAPSAFAASAQTFDLCGIVVSRIRGSASTIMRTEGMIAHDDPGQLVLVVHLDGEYRIDQAGQTFECVAGDVIAYDSARPYAVRAASRLDVATFAVSKALIGPAALRDGEPLQILADESAVRLAAPFLCQVARALEHDELDAGDQHVADAVRSLIRGLVTVRREAPAQRLVEIGTVKRYIDEHLGDPDLAPERIATAHCISRRHLYKLFEGERTGVSEWIRDRRLEACRRDLRDRSLDHETILSIAMRWGFGDASHFSHCFRAAYGSSPRQFRAADS